MSYPISTFFTSSTKRGLTFGLIGLGLIVGMGDCVHNDEMAPTLPKYSWVWSENIQPEAVQIGDLVWVTDPHHPERLHMRRVIGQHGDQMQYINDGFLRNGKRFPVLDMREWEEHSRVWKETFYQDNQEISWEIIQPNQNTEWHNTKSTIADGSLYLACDHRAKCTDSRWWGAISKTRIEKKIQFGLCLFCKEGMNKRSIVLYY